MRETELRSGGTVYAVGFAEKRNPQVWRNPAHAANTHNYRPAVIVGPTVDGRARMLVADFHPATAEMLEKDQASVKDVSRNPIPRGGGSHNHWHIESIPVRQVRMLWKEYQALLKKEALKQGKIAEQAELKLRDARLRQDRVVMKLRELGVDATGFGNPLRITASVEHMERLLEEMS